MLRKLFGFVRNASGVSAVEFALLAPVMTMTFGLAVDGGLASNGQMAIEGASRAGADYAAIHGASSADAAAVVATNSTSWPVTVSTRAYCGCAGSAGIAQQSCSGGSCSDGSSVGNYFAVTATANYTPMFASFWTVVVPGVMALSHTTVARTS